MHMKRTVMFYFFEFLGKFLRDGNMRCWAVEFFCWFCSMQSVNLNFTKSNGGFNSLKCHPHSTMGPCILLYKIYT